MSHRIRPLGSEAAAILRAVSVGTRCGLGLASAGHVIGGPTSALSICHSQDGTLFAARYRLCSHGGTLHVNVDKHIYFSVRTTLCALQLPADGDHRLGASAQIPPPGIQLLIEARKQYPQLRLNALEIPGR